MKVSLRLVLTGIVLVGSTTGLFPSEAAQNGLRRVTAWLVEWDLAAGLQEFHDHAALFDEIHLFAAHFESGRLVTHADWSDYIAALQSWKEGGAERSVWMTVVNDRVNGKTVIQKDASLVTSLISFESSRQNHIKDLAELAKRYSVDGIELDYENVRPADWTAYMKFVEEASSQLAAQGIGLQIVLQPAERLKESSSSVRRTVMSYNLFGLHSGPGPKNTPGFVERIAAWIGRDHTGDFRIAFATGGFNWGGKPRIQSLRESDAKALLETTDSSLKRTADGNAHFSYRDKNGDSHEVWFEDAKSLEQQWKTAQRAGFNEVALWRLGGNASEIYKFLEDQKQKAVSTFFYNFNQDGLLQEAGEMRDSTSPYWWLNSGAYLAFREGRGWTIQGTLEASDYWRRRYAASNPLDTNDGLHPQNIFRLITRRTWENAREEAVFMVTADNRSDSPNRNETNGLLLFNRYLDSNNLYYAGVRVDGAAIIKKKLNGVYYTLAYEPGIFPGIYDRRKNPNLLPQNKWIGLRSEIITLSNGSVKLQLYIDKNGQDNWVLAAEAIDDGQPFGPPVANAGYGGIRTDFMDVSFKNFRVVALSPDGR